MNAADMILSSMLIIKYIIDVDNGRFLGFQVKPVRETDTVSSYLEYILAEEMNASKRHMQSPCVWCFIVSCWNMLTESECLCRNGVGIVAGITNESKISH